VQEHDLWRAGADVYAPGEYLQYKKAYEKGRQLLVSENARFRWFRNYEHVAEDFRAVLSLGQELGRMIAERKASAASNAANRLGYLRNRMATLKRLSSVINEGRFSRRHITKAELLLEEAEGLIREGLYLDAEDRLRGATLSSDAAVESLLPVINRYSDRSQIKLWRTWVEQTIGESRQNGGYAAVVSKIDRSLILYKAGRHLRTYQVGIGFNGTRDKLHSGDRATPEGQYHIVKKNPNSRFHKALLINYPHDRDRGQFAAARKKGLIPRGAGIGGLIEIHGGGKDGMTYGCIALDNKEMEELFSLLPVGTPVTIVGAVEYENSISEAMKGL
jgi:hypothetical protein